MKEIRFLKDLPCKLVNKNQDYIKLCGGDIYYDKDGARYAYLTFENLNRSPIFFIQLALREYSADGKLVKEEQFVIPYLFAPKGEFVNETPISISEETEAMEVLIVKATFDNKNFIDDKLVNFTEEDYCVKPQVAPLKKWEAESQYVLVRKDEVGKVNLTSQAKPAEQPKVEEKAEVLSEEVSGEVVEETPTLEEKQIIQEEVSKVDLGTLKEGKIKKKNKLLFFIILGVVVAIVVGVLIFGIIIGNYYAGQILNS